MVGGEATIAVTGAYRGWDRVFGGLVEAIVDRPIRIAESSHLGSVESAKALHAGIKGFLAAN